MSYEIAIVNPRKRRRKKASAAQVAARRRFVAKFAKGRRRRKARKSSPSTTSGVSAMAKRRKRRSTARNRKGHFVKRARRSTKRVVSRRRRRSSAGKRHPAMGYTVGSRKIRRRKLNPRGSRRRYKRNPRFLPSLGGLTNQLMPAALGAGGAMALNIGLSYLPIPDSLKTGWTRHGVRLVGALGLGWLAKKFLGAKGNAVALGALTVVLYDFGKEVANTFVPQIGSRLGEFEDVSLADGGFVDAASPIRGMGAYLDGRGVGAYLDGNLDGTLDGEYDGAFDGAMDGVYV